MLSDLGYDVWMANNRGTQYSQKHISLDAEEDNKFWEFSWAEMGLYDVPANIKLVKEVTGKKPFYIGHSQGTTQMLYALAKEKQRGGSFYAHNLQKAVLLSVATLIDQGTTYAENEAGLF